MRKIGIMLGALALANCVGTDTRMLDQRTALISGRGNAFAKPSDVHNKILHQAALIAQERGYTHFAILDLQDASSVGTYYQPGTTTTSTTGMVSCGAYNCIGSATSNTSGTPGYAMPIFKPGADMAVRLLRADEVMPDMPGVWSVQDVLAIQ